MIWETLATDGFGNPLADLGNSTFPGEACNFSWEVTATQTTVAMSLRL